MKPMLSQRGKRAHWAELAINLPVPLRLLAGLAFLALTGTLLFFIPGVTTRPFLFDEALFTAVSALTVTGLMTINPATDLTVLGQVILLFLMQLGGIGVMIFTVIMFRLMGKQIPLVDRLAMRNVLGVIEPGAVVRLAWKVLLGVFVVEGVGALLLGLHWRRILMDQLGDGWDVAGYAIFHAISAFCNAGFDLFTGRQGFPGGIPTDPVSLIILSVLVVMGGLGVPVLTDLLTFTVDHKLTLHTRITLVVVAGLIVIGGVGIFVAEVSYGSIQPGESLLERLGISFFQSISARSGGFSGVLGFDKLSPASQFLLVLLMFIGASPASMGGGITTGTAVVLGLAMVSYIRNRPVPELKRRSISMETVRRATAVLTLSLLVITAATWLLLISQPKATLIQAFFEVVSAFSTCGLSLAFTSRLDFFGQLVIMLVMFWGRIGPITVIVALARPKEQSRLQYPEEQILIG